MSAYIMTLTLPDRTGAAKMALQFATSLVKKGHRVLLIHGVPPEARNGNLDESVLPAMLEAGIETKMDRRLTTGRFWVSRDLAKTARKCEAQAIIGVNQRDRPFALKAAALAGISGIISVQNQHRFWGSKVVSFAKRTFYTRYVRKFARLAVCTSEPVQKELTEWMKVPVDRTVILQNGIDTSKFPTLQRETLLEIRRSLGVEEDTFLWLNVGRIDYQKGLDLLVEALGKLRQHNTQWKLISVGTVTSGTNQNRMQDYFEKLKQRVRELNLQERVIFAGWRSDVAQLLSAADGYVHSARYEGSPLAVLEAMAAGNVIVTPDNTSRPAGFDDKLTGLVARPLDADHLAQQMSNAMISDQPTRDEWRRNAKLLAQRDYDIEAIGSRFVELVETHSGPFRVR